MLKTAWRSITKAKSLSIIHVSGLAIAIATATVLFLTAMFELSYDNFHKYGDRIGLLYNHSQPVTGDKFNSSMPVPLAPQLKASIPSVEAVTRFAHENLILKNGDKEIVSMNRFVDPDFFQIFSFPFINGNENSLSELNGIVLTSSMANNLFGKTEVIGKSIQANIDGEWRAFQVSAVTQDIPKNSSLEYNSLMRFENKPGYQILLDLWDNQNHEVYVKVKGEKIDDQAFTNEAKSFTNQYFKENIDRLKRDGGQTDKNGSFLSFHLMPLSKIHLNDFSPGASMSSNFPYILLIISGLILFIAASNFINLSLANSITRNREIGTRKTLGGTTWNIVKQLWLESLILCILALFFGLLLAFFVIPEYNAILKYQLKITDLFNTKNLVIFLLSISLLTVIAGGLPAFKIARTNIIQSLKGSSKIKSSKLRATLTVIQFSIATTLIIATIVISSQLNYMANKPLGYNKSEVISIPIGSVLDKESMFNLTKIELENQPWVKSVSASDINFGRGRDGSMSRSQYGFEYENREIITNFMRIDYDYLKTLDIKLVAGRDLDRSFKTDTNAILVNRQMAALLGDEDKIIGQKIPLNGGVTVVGIVDDYNFMDLKSKVLPLTLSANPNVFPVEYIFVRVETNQLGETLKRVEDIWKKINPKATIAASYLDENTQNLYQSDQNFSRIIISGTSIAIIISCLGLFAISLLTINTRIKEIGIRKVLGSSVSSIIVLLSKDFVKLVLIAFLVAAPLAWWAMNNWLQAYAYRINIQWWMFVMAAVISIAIAWSTIAWQALRAANANPVDSLRDE